MSASTPVNPIPALAPRARRYSWLGLSSRAMAGLFLLWLLSRWVVDVMWNLVPDEAYYWVWSRHLALSYFDHPPMVAYLIRLGTLAVGDTELGVRWLAAILSAGTVLILTLATQKIVSDPRAVGFVPLSLLLSPLVAVTGSIMTPDAPSCFFQAAALAAALRVFSPGGSPRHWIYFGVFIGLALDSKYTSILLPFAVMLAMISCIEGRRALLSPWPWLAAVIALALFSPVLFWNYRHDWASFRYQLHHGAGEAPPPAWKNLLSYLGGQIGVCTPVLFGACLAALIIFARRRNNPMPVRILLCAAAAPLLFFAVTAIRHRPEANWPMFAYFPAIVLFAIYLGESAQRRRFFWAQLAIIVAAVCTLGLHAPDLIWKKFPAVGSPQWDNLYGWRELAQRQVDPLRMDSPVLTADYEYASEMLFYLPPGAVVWPLSDPTRPTAFDFFPDHSPLPSVLRAVIIRRLAKNLDPPGPWHVLGAAYDYTDFTDAVQFKDSRLIRRSLIEVAQLKSP
jgi:4-amino-4-deoxy-L-arabinose transferase-like glycosyltransferase